MKTSTRATIDPYTSRSNAIAVKVAEKSIVRKLQEIGDAVERKCKERRNGEDRHAS